MLAWQGGGRCVIEPPVDMTERAALSLFGSVLQARGDDRK
jgi:hypothetical protein